MLKAQAPVADFTSNRTSGCGPLSVSFSDNSSNEPKFWNWDFGNGQLSNQQNPTVTYTQPGTYTVTLVVRNADGTNGTTKTDYITVNPSPRANFTVSSTSGCIPSLLRFTDQSTTSSGTITSWQWNFGDGNSSTEQNPTHTYTEPGFYTVSLRVSSNTGCENAVTRFRLIRIVSGVEADFTFSNPATCNPPFAVNFLNQGSGPGELTHRWELDAAGNSNEVSPTGIFNAPGDYTIRLITNSEFGCGDSVTKTITLQSIPTDFTGEDSACIGSTLNFQNNSGQTALSTSWYLDNVLISNEQQISRNFPVAGTYTLKMVNQYQSCPDSAIRQITILDNPVASFTADPRSSCAAPLEVTFTDQTPGSVSWNWDFGDGAQSTDRNPVHRYEQAGQYTVRLTMTDRFGCSDTATQTDVVTIRPPRAAIRNARAGGCVPFTYSPVENVSSIDGVASWFWDFGNGQTSTLRNPTVTYNAVGNYTLRLRIVTNEGCEDSIVVNNAISVGTPPTVDFDISTDSICAGRTVSFTDLSTNVDRWLWDFGDGDTSEIQHPVHHYRDTGSFSVSLTGYNNGCPVTRTRANIIHVSPPVAAFAYRPDCAAPTRIQFTNTSIVDPGRGPVGYVWHFGDPQLSTSTAPNPQFTYPSPGTYRVMLIAINGNCRDTLIQNIILVNNTADFTISKETVCRNEAFTLTAINSNPGSIVSYRWQIGNDSFDGTREIRRSRSGTGTFDVRLTITDSNGCVVTNTVDDLLTVRGSIASFTPAVDAACHNSPVEFIDASTSTGTITRRIFDFGDSTRQEFTTGPYIHNYTDTGFFNVRLTVEDEFGCTNSQTRANAVYISRPVAAFSQDSVLHCPGAPLAFEDSSSGRDLSFVWDFGDGTTSTERNPVHTYTGGDDIYTVRLQVTDSLGCTDSLIRNNYITIRSPKAAFSVTDTLTICPPLETLFTLEASDYESFYWDFGDSTEISLSENPRHFYNEFQTFTAKLYAVGFGGCIDSAQQDIRLINPNSTVINYSPLTACNELEVNFDINPPSDTRFVFSFGDGSSDSSQTTNLTHLYNSPATYNPSILITDVTGCQARIGAGPAIRVIGAQPLFGIDENEFCDSGTVYFTNYTLGNDPVVDYRWDFGDGSTVSGEDDQVHRYTRSGVMIPRLTVTTRSGCTDFITDTIQVYATPDAQIIAADTVCVNAPVIFSAELLRPDTVNVNYSWAFGNGNNSTLRQPNELFNAPGDYTVRLDTRVAFGCNATTQKNLHVVPLPGVEPIQAPVIMSGGSTELQVNYSGPIVSYNWSPPLGLSCTQCPLPVATPRYTTTYSIKVTDRHGCENTGETTVNVVCGNQNLFIPNTFSPNGDGRNDAFYPRGTGLDQIKSLRIFNRWGELIFEKINFPANQAAAGWDGRIKGKPAPPDVYVYTVEVVCDNGQVFPYSGNVMLVR